VNNKTHILIAGAGVAGSSLAIRLAQMNFRVTLVEREKFPRHKLCGEFISPEALLHFEKLGVMDEMLAVGGDRISETVFYSQSGRSVSVPSGWFEHGNSGALSISRAEMDLRLLNRAKELGVEVLEETSVTKLHAENGRVSSVKLKNRAGEIFEREADLFVDATGRARILAKQTETKQVGRAGAKNKQTKIKFVAFKAHLKNADIEAGVCEIYAFRGGYGGLSRVENGAANCCFIIKADVVREYGADVERVFREVLLKNRRAFSSMSDAEPLFDWIAVSIDGFGKKELIPAANLISIGDAAAFIDPFTGSGMLMALESSELLFGCISQTGSSSAETAQKYRAAYQQKFWRRLIICRVMRYASFSPKAAAALIFILSLNKSFRHFLTRNTRTQDTHPTHNFPL
jgi:flavin-dependent dehydrogenase